MVRHGHRESIKDNKQSQLTLLGRQESYALGAERRLEYSKSLLPPRYSPRQHLFISTNYDRTEQTAIEIFQGWYPLENPTMSEKHALAFDLSKSMFNPARETSLHAAILIRNSTRAVAVARTTSLPDALFQGNDQCPAFRRIIIEHDFDMQHVHDLILDSFRPQVGLLDQYY